MRVKKKTQRMAPQHLDCSRMPLELFGKVFKELSSLFPLNNEFSCAFLYAMTFLLGLCFLQQSSTPLHYDQ